MRKLIITCEHGGNEIPKAYQPFFVDARKRLDSHEGWDIGALNLAKELSPIADNTLYSTLSRLLIDLNRSISHPKIFSDITRSMAPSKQLKIVDKYYFPYRYKVVSAITDFLAMDQPVLHLSVHSFTPSLLGKERKTDLGLLFDPERKDEKFFCDQWKKLIQMDASKFKVRLNYPYLGKSDGLVTSLRMQFPHDLYIGVELEVNQALLQNPNLQPLLAPLLINTLKQTDLFKV